MDSSVLQPQSGQLPSTSSAALDDGGSSASSTPQPCTSKKVAEIFLTAGQAFDRLSELCMDLHCSTTGLMRDSAAAASERGITDAEVAGIGVRVGRFVDDLDRIGDKFRPAPPRRQQQSLPSVMAPRPFTVVPTGLDTVQQLRRQPLAVDVGAISMGRPTAMVTQPTTRIATATRRVVPPYASRPGGPLSISFSSVHPGNGTAIRTTPSQHRLGMLPSNVRLPVHTNMVPGSTAKQPVRAIIRHQPYQILRTTGGGQSALASSNPVVGYSSRPTPPPIVDDTDNAASQMPELQRMDSFENPRPSHPPGLHRPHSAASPHPKPSQAAGGSISSAGTTYAQPGGVAGNRAGVEQHALPADLLDSSA